MWAGTGSTNLIYTRTPSQSLWARSKTVNIFILSIPTLSIPATRAMSAQQPNTRATILKDNVFASQFHPEKSGEKGLLILKKFFK
jgi:imidazoleglycerol phosphate synthase glutamine amidotransferase subunit HisH